jgi:hypothetical protein
MLGVPGLFLKWVGAGIVLATLVRYLVLIELRRLDESDLQEKRDVKHALRRMNSPPTFLFKRSHQVESKRNKVRTHVFQELVRDEAFELHHEVQQ